RPRLEQSPPRARREANASFLFAEEPDHGHFLACVPPPQKQRGSVAPRFERLAPIVLQGRMLAAQREQLPVPAQRRLSGGAVAPTAVDLAALERLLVLRVRNFAAPGERLEFLAPSVAHRFDEGGVVVAHEILERFGRVPLLSLEGERQRGRERGEGGGDAQAAR